ncbi:MAG: gliding motility-associated C-terminal domain-containing protein [Candidatus Latescibacteria bacterium]|nr:gliding motility-associated C-terminal domain-containing protein [Candidatus Latescibacterota bacterium]
MPFLLCLAFFLQTAPLAAVDSVGVAHRARIDRVLNPWNANERSSRFVRVGADSVWMWGAAPGANLTPGLAQRQGRFFLEGVDGILRPTPAIQLLADGDPGTTFDPDSLGLPRDAVLLLDLGGTFGVDRIRLHPRMDRRHLRKFLQEFRVETGVEGITGDFETLLDYTADQPNQEPLLDRPFPSRPVRYLRLTPTTQRPWEVAELEIYADGTVPLGEFTTIPLDLVFASAVWGRVRYEGGLISGAPVVVQTRTGPDPEPELYFRRIVEDSDGEEDLVEVDRKTYLGLLPAARGPIRPNPTWSPWERVADDLVRSPGFRRFIQARLLFLNPGTALRRLVIEYTRPAVFQELEAEMSPLVVDPGVETSFTLSALVSLEGKGTDLPSGFSLVQVRTTAQIRRVDQVLIDDRAIPVRVTMEPGEGFTVDLRRRLSQSGTFLQIHFRGTLFRDQTRFEVGAVDRREGGLSYQVGHAEEVDERLEGSGLVVRLRDAEKAPLLSVLQAPQLFTPNGDGINDRWVLNYTLIKLLKPVPLSLEVYDLSGREVYRSQGEEDSGNHTLSWDGRGGDGQLLAPGLYLYELHVQADEETRHRGVVGVSY